jgi:hypothetical protein
MIGSHHAKCYVPSIYKITRGLINVVLTPRIIRAMRVLLNKHKFMCSLLERCHSPTRRSNPTLMCNAIEGDVTFMLTAMDGIYPLNYSNIYEETSPIEQFFTFLVGNPSYSTQYYSPSTT